MIRIIEGVAYEGNYADALRLRAYDLGSGHIEVSGYKPVTWSELDWSPDQVADHLAMIEQYRLDHADDIRQRNRERAAQRAKSNVRRLCKVASVDTLLTLTYRENQTSLELTKTHLKEFVRRLRRVWPEFLAIAAFERQKRGAWHVHMATRAVPPELASRSGCKVKSFNLIRSIWRSVVGADNGNIDVARRKRTSQRSPAKLSSYLSKYVLKAFVEGDDHTNRWTKFGDFSVPPALDFGSDWDLMRSVVAAFDLAAAGTVATAYLSPWGDSLFMAFECCASDTHRKNFSLDNRQSDF